LFLGADYKCAYLLTYLLTNRVWRSATTQRNYVDRGQR